jgi:hypothetical protein
MGRHCSPVYILILSNVRDKGRPHCGRDRQVQGPVVDAFIDPTAYAVRGTCPAAFLARTADWRRLALFQRPRSRNGGRSSKQRTLQRTSPTKCAGEFFPNWSKSSWGRCRPNVRITPGKRPCSEHRWMSQVLTTFIGAHSLRRAGERPPFAERDVTEYCARGAAVR